MPAAIAQSQTQKNDAIARDFLANELKPSSPLESVILSDHFFSIVLSWHSAGAGARLVVNEPFTVVAVMPASSVCTCRADRN